MDHEELLQDLARRQARARAMGSAERLAERARAGILNARERVDELVDAESFVEVGLHAHSVNPIHADKSPCDGVVTGFGEVDGRPVAIVAHDFTTLGASTATTYSRKTQYVHDVASEKGMPFVQLAEAGGGRLPDSLDGAGFGTMAIGSRRSLGRDRRSPWASAILGASFGGPTWDAVRSDYVAMRKGAAMGVSSERVTSVAISESAREEEFCGWRMHTRDTGMVDAAFETDQEVIADVRREYGGARVRPTIGTMIEVPRAALTADEIARHADFFSFGTNDLTQMTYALSRDDAGSFLPEYVERGLIEADPFVSIDEEGIGQLVRLGVERGRSTRPDLKLGICGEHGGDPPSVRFFDSVGLDYVSCSPYRVPLARLAAAQSAVEARMRGE